jgi:hypothetical protein
MYIAYAQYASGYAKIEALYTNSRYLVLMKGINLPMPEE